jgi:hypothetical protein
MKGRKDVLVLGLAVFYVVMGLGVDLYWFLHRDHLPSLVESSWVARLYRDFAAADRGYYDRVGKMESALEAMNISVTQVFNLLLVWGVLRDRPWRYPLQLAVGSYVSYSVVLDYWVAHLGGYPNMAEKTPDHMAMFFAGSLPWILGHLYWAADAAAAINRRFREAG